MRPRNTLAVTTVTANHAAGTTLRYTIAGGADAAAFSMDANTGVLRFLTAPDREAPTDAGGDNVYDVVVRAIDTAGLSDAQAIAVSVRNVSGPSRTGTGGADLLNGTGEEEIINGAAGNDSINGYAGHDTLAGGDGSDLITGGDGQDTINGDAGADTLRGDGGNDKLSGGGGRDQLLGGDGADTISGGTGADSIDGGAGSDVISGDAGFDVLTGGAGNDRFVFASTSDIGTGTSAGTRDVITDFTKGVDLIDLGTIGADTGIAGDQAFSLLAGVNAAFTAGGQLRVVTQTIGGVVHTIVEGNTGGTTTPEFRLALVIQVTLTASDFIL